MNNTSQNALRHGIYSKLPILRGENAQEFSDLHEGLRKEWLPDGVSEDEAVFDVAKHHWQKRRLMTSSQVLHNSSPGAKTLTEGDGQGWERIVEDLTKTVKNGGGSRDAVLGAYAPERMERELRICAEIDRRIEKTISRLIAIKEHKRLQRQIKGAGEPKALPVLTSEPSEPERASSSTGAESPTLVPK